MPALWDKPLAYKPLSSTSGSSLRDLRVSVFPLFPEAHGRAYSCRKASMGFIFAARVAG